MKPRHVASRGVKRRRRLLPLWPGALALLVVLLIAGLAAGGVLLVRSGYFEVKRVEISGARHLSPRAVRAQLKLEGRSMFRLNEEGIRSALMEQPVVAAIEVHRSWPHTVSIVITERTPWGYWQRGDALYVVDAQGVVLEGVPPPRGAPLILQTDAVEPLRAGDRVDAGALHLVDRLLALQPSRKEQVPVQFDWAAETGLVVLTETGQRVVFGDVQDFEAKVALWDSLLVALHHSGVPFEEIDLRFGSSPAVRG